MTLATRPVPRTGERIPAVGLGTWQAFDVPRGGPERAAAQETLRALVELGGTVVDSSPMYGAAEQVVGALAAELGLARQALRRDEGVDLRPRRRGPADGGLVRQAGRRPARPDAGAQPGRHRHAPRDARRLEEGGAGALSRRHALHRERRTRGSRRRSGRTGRDFVQLNYSLAEREAERRLLPLAAAEGVAVLVNRPLGQGRMFARVKGKPLPGWASEIDCASWAQAFLKFILGHPAVTCVIPGTRNARHLADNLGAARGRLPDPALRARMAAYFDSV